jgi:hypothetical protein
MGEKADMSACFFWFFADIDTFDSQLPMSAPDKRCRDF